MCLQGKVVLITGGSSGIGRALGEVFGKKGAKIVFTGQNVARIEETEAAYQALQIEAWGLCTDVSSWEENQALVEKVVQRYQRIDILIANAGISMRALFEDLSLHAFRKVMEVNFFGAVYTTKAALPHIVRTKGSVIAISSINGYRSTPARIAYTSSKFAMQGFFDNLRLEVKSDGVHVLVVCPGFTRSNIRLRALSADGSPQGESSKNEAKLMSAEAVAQKTYQAWRKRKRDLILTFSGRFIVWLTKRCPSLADYIICKYMAREANDPLHKKLFPPKV